MSEQAPEFNPIPDKVITDIDMAKNVAYVEKPGRDVIAHKKMVRDIAVDKLLAESKGGASEFDLRVLANSERPRDASGVNYGTILEATKEIEQLERDTAKMGDIALEAFTASKVKKPEYEPGTHDYHGPISD